uniref:hypothetical protein n=1 Tax=Herbidospora sakaeratensis TaxID=564415 RepID=UPI0007839AC0|nr:hypothetical protein [Herbidospora sakaeratensis]
MLPPAILTIAPSIRRTLVLAVTPSSPLAVAQPRGCFGVVRSTGPAYPMKRDATEPRRADATHADAAHTDATHADAGHADAARTDAAHTDAGHSGCTFAPAAFTLDGTTCSRA